MKTTIGILSYNMPHLTDTLYEQLRGLVRSQVEYVVVDNGSDADKVAKCTTHRFADNKRLTGGMNRILDAAKGSDFVWLCTNDISVSPTIDVCPVELMLRKIEHNPKIGVIHPSLYPEPVPGYDYRFMLHKAFAGCVTGHPMVDIICPLYTKAALDAFGWQFDPRFEYGWGIDYDSCVCARFRGLTVAVDHDIRVAHQTSITYDSGRDPEFKNRNEYYSKAFENMNAVMESKYEKNWRKLFPRIA
jgi:GT2 family glycosyltransferase